MTQPMHAIDLRGKGRYYTGCCETCPLGETQYMSVTNAQSVVNKPALPPSAAKITAEHAWALLPAMVATSRQSPNGPNGCDRKRVADRCGTCRFCVTSAIKAQYREQWETKADFGTLVHVHGHAHVLGKPMPYDENVAPFIEQYLTFLDVMGVDLDKHVVAAETTVYDPKNGYAGTGDVWLQLPVNPANPRTIDRTGKRWLYLVDLKTSLGKPANTVYADQELQLAGLRFAPKAVLVDDTVIDVPKFAGAALLNLRATEHAFIPLPSDRNAHKAFLAAVTLQRHFHEQDTKAWQPLDVTPLVEPKGRVA